MDVVHWIFCCLWGAAFALVATYSWRRRTDPFQPLLDAVRT
jgi:hypothetical protein